VSYLQAFIIAVVQGVTELFPVSSLGHSVLIPAWIGGSWQTMVTQSSQASSETSFYLAYIVALHCATALALLWFFRADWARIIRGLLTSLLRGLREHRPSIQGPDERLAWTIVIATIPVGLTGIGPWLRWRADQGHSVPGESGPVSGIGRACYRALVVGCVTQSSL
jgi:undecaprenyl-diphosphatase